MDLRVEHTHCFSTHGDGGHYHEDVTPEQVVYEGYFTPAERLFRIDRPSETHGIGRDWLDGPDSITISSDDKSNATRLGEQIRPDSFRQ